MLAYLFTILAALVLSTSTASAGLLHHVDNAAVPSHVHHMLRRPDPSSNHSVLLTLAQDDPELAGKLVAERSDPSSPLYLQWLDRATLGALLAGKAESVAQVNSWLGAAPGVTVSEQWGPYVQVTGSVAAVERLFNTTLATYYNTVSNLTTVRQTGMSWLPSHVEAHVVRVDGLHTGDIVSPVRAMVVEPRGGNGGKAVPRAPHKMKPLTYQGWYTSAELASRYGTPNSITATATNTNSPTSISVIQLSDSENYDPNGVNIFGTDEGFAISPLASLITGVELISPGATNDPTTGSNDESMLDLEAVLSVTTTSKFYAQKVGGQDAGYVGNLFGYFARSNPLPQVMSLSYSYTESQFSAGTLASYESQVQSLVAMGVTFLAATGDSGYNSNIGWPATSAYVLAVGGTHFAGTGSSITETAWSGSTGGISSQIARPSYQTTANTGVSTTYRTVPDVAALADTWFLVYGDQGAEKTEGVGGTSLATPLWAGVVTYLNAVSLQLRGSTLGFINPLLYQMAAQCSTCFHDITSGTSNGYSAKAGYDLVTGLGSPNLPAMKTYLTNLLSSSSSTGSSSSQSPPASPPASPTAPPASGSTSCSSSVAGYFGNSAYNTLATAGAGYLYTVPITVSSAFTAHAVGLQRPAGSGTQQRQTSVVQFALYQYTGTAYTLIASAPQQSITGASVAGSAIYGNFTGSGVALTAGTTYYAGLLIVSTGSAGVSVYMNGNLGAPIGPEYSGNSLPASFTSLRGTYPFRMEILGC